MDLGLGETEVLALALESTDAIVILDDALARQMATTSRWLLLDSRVVDVPMAYTPTFAILSSLKPLPTIRSFFP